MTGVDSVDWGGEVALIRADLNVPLDSCGKVADDARIERSLPTIEHVLGEGGGCAVISHLGRPREGCPDPGLSLRPVYEHMARNIGQKRVRFADLANACRPRGGEVLLLENARFNPGETSCAPVLCEQYAGLGTAFVFDAFASAHRAEASTVGVAKHFSRRMAGILMMDEVRALRSIFAASGVLRPFVAVVGGAKVSTKLGLLKRLLAQVDCAILGGGIANTFLAAAGKGVGRSLAEPSMLKDAALMLDRHSGKILLQSDGKCAESPEADSAKTVSVDEVGANDMLLDIGPVSAQKFAEAVAGAKTILWNGPVGLFEKEPFSSGTEAVGRAIAASPAYSVAGGGDTLNAIRQFALAEGISHISTGGGAMLAFLEGSPLPAMEMLETPAGDA